ncbi:MAG: hypothetical protein ACPGWR_08250 [Ardenticatenaceae bacterium]
MPQNHQPISKQAGIIVTFYGPRSEMQGFQEKVGQGLKLIKANYGFKDMSDPYRKIFLRSFKPPPAHDTTVVQLALSESDTTQPHDAKRVWPIMRGKLEKGLKEVVREGNQPKKAPFWGYSVIYYATLLDGVSLDSLDQERRDDLFRLARPPHSRSPNRPEPQPEAEPEPEPKPESLAHTNLLGCCELWLMDIANEGDGAQAATIYMALSPPNKGKEMRTQVLYGAGARLLMADLIAHKSYHQKRQYTHNPEDPQNPLRTLYKKKVDELHHIIESLLLRPPSAPENENHPLDLGKLKFVYRQVLSATGNLDDLRRSLAQQLKNYQWWRKQLGQGNLATYHYQQIEIAKEELDLLIDKGLWMLEAARTTIEMVQTEQNEAREVLEKKIGDRVTILGIALALSQIIDKMIVEALLNTSAGQSLLNLLNYISGWSLSSDNRLLQFVGQLLIIGLLMRLIYWGYHRWRHSSYR